MYKFIGLALVLIFSFTAQASSPRWYQVEVIIFKHNNPADRNLETWKTSTPAVIESYPDWRSATVIGRYQAKPSDVPDVLGRIPFTPVAKEQQQLNDIYAQIRWSKHYTPLHQAAWIQPGYARDDPHPVQIKLDTAPDVRGLNAFGEVISPYDSLVTGVRGTIDVTLGSYLHVNVDLIYREPNSNNQDEFSSIEGYEIAPSYQDYRLQESRRVKLNDIYYFDHPAIGVVARVVRAEGES